MACVRGKKAADDAGINVYIMHNALMLIAGDAVKSARPVWQKL